MQATYESTRPTASDPLACPGKSGTGFHRAGRRAAQRHRQRRQRRPFLQSEEPCANGLVVVSGHDVLALQPGVLRGRPGHGPRSQAAGDRWLHCRRDICNRLVVNCQAVLCPDIC